jgi:hypothetical protein
MRGGKGQVGEAKLAATEEDKRSRINGLNQMVYYL